MVVVVVIGSNLHANVPTPFPSTDCCTMKDLVNDVFPRTEVKARSHETHTLAGDFVAKKISALWNLQLTSSRMNGSLRYATW